VEDDVRRLQNQPAGNEIEKPDADDISLLELVKKLEPDAWVLAAIRGSDASGALGRARRNSRP
jgi:hypothetical protein